MVCVSVCIAVKGIEDAQGNMDFKVAGTSEGITSLQARALLYLNSHATLYCNNMYNYIIA